MPANRLSTVAASLRVEATSCSIDSTGCPVRLTTGYRGVDDGCHESHRIQYGHARPVGPATTELANERTLLAYVRTALGFIIVGVPTVWWVDQPHVQLLGAASLAAGFLCAVLGIRRFYSVRRLIAASCASDEGV